MVTTRSGFTLRALVAACILILPASASAVEVEFDATGSLEVSPDFAACAHATFAQPQIIVIGHFSAHGYVSYEPHANGGYNVVTTVAPLELPPVPTDRVDICIPGVAEGGVGVVKYTFDVHTLAGDYTTATVCSDTQLGDFSCS